MAREIINIEADFFGLIMHDWQIDVRGQAGNESVTGAGQVVYGNQPRWRAAIDFTSFQRDKGLAWRSIMDRLRGRVNVLRVKVCDPLGPTMSELGLGSSDKSLAEGAGIPHSDDTTFSDDAGYAITIPSPLLLTNAVAGETSVSIDGDKINNGIRDGQMFAVDDWLYRITSVTGTGVSTIVSFEPPLRRTAPSGSAMSFNPYALMVVGGDLAGPLEIGLAKISKPSLKLIEWTNRP